ncbi:nuclear transport factor 2 family protein [Nonomuraea sp. NPDC050663]|uniref:nuclear transport factor 2 family protein n=1 Tax=Nonomuraea sp. NPDC050663 TaxID=3364370 RepID=UPI0037AA4AD0
MTNAVERFYAAMLNGDVRELLAVLHPEFVLDVSRGMPLGVGGVHHGPKAALKECWGVIFGAYETAPVPDDYVWSGEERCVAMGAYRGRLRATGEDYEAAFSHDLRLRDGLIVRLAQVTDTASWPAPR